MGVMFIFRFVQEIHKITYLEIKMLVAIMLIFEYQIGLILRILISLEKITVKFKIIYNIHRILFTVFSIKNRYFLKIWI